MTQLDPYNLLTVGIAAFGGTILGAFLQNWLFRRREKFKEDKQTVQTHLAQLQYSAESLWYRLHNLSSAGGKSLMTQEYYVTSTLYALGRLLAQKLIFESEGAYVKTERISPGLGNKIRSELGNVDAALNNINYRYTPHKRFFRFERQLLAESVVSRTDNNSVTLTYLEFKWNYDTNFHGLKDYLNESMEFVTSLNEQDWGFLLQPLNVIRESLSKFTLVEST